MIAPATKVCSKCSLEKPVTAFHKKRAQCKDCRSVYMSGYWRDVRSRGLTVRPDRSSQVAIEASDHPMQQAVAAFKNCWCHYQPCDGARVKTPYTGVTAEQVVDGMFEGWRERVRLLQEVCRMARERG